VLDHRAAIRADADIFYETAASADAAATVPSCPDWSVADLLWHLAEVHYFWGYVIENGITHANDLAKIKRAKRPENVGDTIAFGRSSTDRLLALLENTDPSQHVWTWSTRHDVAFIGRHQVQETAVHRWDMQAATRAAPSPIDAAAAADAIDEFLHLTLPMARANAEPLAGIVHVHCTDVEGEWVLHEDGTIETTHARGDVALRGAASDLLLVLYRRLPLDAVEVIGDQGIAEQLFRQAKLE
jgi:uncharacterized protein (TIGR03083 family)